MTHSVQRNATLQMRCHSRSPVVHKDERVLGFHIGPIRMCLLRDKWKRIVDIARLVRPNRIRLQQIAYSSNGFLIGEFGSYQHLGVHCNSCSYGNGLVSECFIVRKGR